MFVHPLVSGGDAGAGALGWAVGGQQTTAGHWGALGEPDLCRNRPQEFFFLFFFFVKEGLSLILAAVSSHAVFGQSVSLPAALGSAPGEAAAEAALQRNVL